MKPTSARWAAAAVCGVALLLHSCSSGPGTSEFADDLDALSPDSVVTGAGAPDSTGFVWQTEQFADIKMIRYQVPGWEKLSPKQQALVFCLNQAGLSGRDMIWDQNNRYNLAIRDVLEGIYTGYTGDKATKGWHRFETYLKRVWFSNGIHHHYANTKILPEFTRAYFEKIAKEAGVEVSEELLGVIFDPAIEPKRVELDATKGLCESSSVNFYAPDVTTEEAQAFYAALANPEDRTPVEHGLNSRLVKGMEDVYKVGGLYGSALEQVVFWLNEALKYTENDRQAAALRHLIAYYETGDLEKWKLFNINWVQDTEGVVDYIHGFVEVYNDPLGHKGTFESIVQIKDFDASERMKTLMENAQWFEDHMPFLPAHKKKRRAMPLRAPPSA
jgi:dipeptidyl-peptidase-3